MLWRFREQIWWKWNSAITNHWWSVDLLRAATHNVVWPLAAWSAAPSPLAPWSPPLATRGPGSCPLLLPNPPPPLARSETSNWSTTDNREQLSDNDDDCSELTPANVSWWKGVKAKYLLQLRPYNIFCFQWRLRWKKLCQTVGKFLNHKSMLRWDLGDTECNDILTSKILYFG